MAKFEKQTIVLAMANKEKKEVEALVNGFFGVHKAEKRKGYKVTHILTGRAVHTYPFETQANAKDFALYIQGGDIDWNFTTMKGAKLIDFAKYKDTILVSDFARQLCRFERPKNE